MAVDVDFFDLKHIITLLFGHIGKLRFTVRDDIPMFHALQCATIYLANKEIGVIGRLHPHLVHEFDLEMAPYLFEVNIDDILPIAKNQRITSSDVSKFQKLQRDLSFTITNKQSAGDMLDAIIDMNIANLLSVHLFDVYKINDDCVSVAFKLTFQAIDRTLTDTEANECISLVIDMLHNKFNATLRSKS